MFIKFIKKPSRSTVPHLKLINSHNFRVPNAKPGRDSLKYEIYGMEGIPAEEPENPNLESGNFELPSMAWGGDQQSPPPTESPPSDSQVNTTSTYPPQTMQPQLATPSTIPIK